MNIVFVTTVLAAVFAGQLAGTTEQDALLEQDALVNFQNQKEASAWSAVNDGVMGGRSVGKIKSTTDGAMQFFGTLSLENNGGFASIRSGRLQVEMDPQEAFRVRVKGDGRTYIFNLYPKTRRMAFSYRASLPTVAGEWTEVTVPLEDFTPTSFGRRVQNKGPLSPDQISGIGFMLSDKKAGPFELEIQWVRIEPASVEDSP